MNQVNYYQKNLILNAVKNKLRERELFSGKVETLFLKAMLTHNPEDLNAFFICAADLINSSCGMSPFYSPTTEDINGKIKIGMSENNVPVSLGIDSGHCVIFGRTRSGKSVILFMILAQAIKYYENVVFWLFSRSEEMRKLLSITEDIALINFDGQVRYNPLPKEDNIARFTDPFIQATGLFDGTDNYFAEQLYKLKLENPSATFRDLYYFIISQKYLTNSRQDYYKQSALNRMGGILRGRLGNFLKPGKDSFEDFVKMNTIFEINELRSWESIMIVNWLILHLVDWKRKNKSGIHHIIALDDATPLFHKMFDLNPRRPIFSDIIDIVAKDDIQVIVLSQSPSQVMQCLHAETNVKIVLKLSDMADAVLIAQKMGVEKEYRDKLYWLPDRIGMIGMNNMPALPFKVLEMPCAEFSQHTPEWIKENNARLLGIPPDNQQDREENLEPEKEPVDKDEKKFLFTVYSYQFRANLTDIASVMMIKASSVSRFVESLKLKGLIQTVQISIKKGRYTFPLITEKGCKELGLEMEQPKTRGGGIEHIIFVYLIADKFERNENFQVEKEFYIGDNHHADIAIMPKDEYKPIVIEVSITSSADDELNNIKKALALGAVIVICACKDKKTRDKLAGMTEGRKEVVVCMIHELLDCKKDPLELMKLL